MEPIRVLQVVGKMHRAGMETFIMNIYRNIDRSKIQFDFITHYEEKGDYDDEIERLGGKIYRFPVMNNKNLIKYFYNLNNFFKLHKEYEIIHGHWATFGLFYMYIAKKNNIKYRISHAHSSSFNPGLRGKSVRILIKPMKYICNYYFACSEKACYWLYGKNKKISEKVNIVKNAIDLDKFKFNPRDREEYRKQLNIENKIVIGNVGRLHYSKNQDFLIEIFNEIYKQNNNARLILVGGGEEKSKLINKAQILGLTEEILFVGVREDIPEIMSAMDIFVFPSRYEALGIVAIEAQAMGLPTIVSNAIPREAHITNLIKSLPLNRDAKYWAKEILSLDIKERINVHDSIKGAGYDVKKQAKLLQDFYIDLLN